MWWKSAVNRSFFLCLAAFRTRPSACDTRSRHCVRNVRCWLAFSLASALRSTASAAGRPVFVRRLHRYYNGVRLLTPMHHRLGLLAFPMRASRLFSLWPDMRSLRSGAFLSKVMWPSTPAERQHLALLSVPHMLTSHGYEKSRPPRFLSISWLDPTPHQIFALAVTDDYATLVTGRHATASAEIAMRISAESECEPVFFITVARWFSTACGPSLGRRSVVAGRPGFSPAVGVPRACRGIARPSGRSCLRRDDRTCTCAVPAVQQGAYRGRI